MMCVFSPVTRLQSAMGSAGDCFDNALCVKAGLSPQILELTQAAPYNHTKEIVKDEVSRV